MATTAPAANLTAQGLYHGWMPTADVRGTIDILWGCLTTIFICVWTVIHPRIPNYPKERLKFSGNRTKWLRGKIVETNLIPALAGLIFPECIAASAVSDFIGARRTREILNHGKGDILSTTHGFALNMGVFCLKTPSGRLFRLTFDNVHHLYDTEGSTDTFNPYDTGQIIPESTTGIFALQNKEWIQALEEVSKDDINALSKTDNLSKTIASFKTIWFATQVVSRLVGNRTVTLLEVATSIYVVLALIAYLFWWKKPQNCSMPLMIDCSENVIARLPRSDIEDIEFFAGATHSYMISTEAASISFAYLLLFTFGIIIFQTWYTTIPTQLELPMWRSSSIFSAVGQMLPFLVVLLAVVISRVIGKDSRRATGPFFLLTIPLYIIARLYMIFEMFFSMRALPRSAYDTVSWSAAIPHI